MAKTNPAFMSGVPELLVLRLLSREEMYGYQLVRAIRVVSNEAFQLAEGVVYPLLHGLLAKGYLKARKEEAGGRQRVYYSISKKGLLRLEQLDAEWMRVRTGMDQVLGEK